MDFTEFSKILGGSTIGVVSLMVFLNYMGHLLWKSQVDREIKALVDSAAREIKAIVDAAAKLDVVRLEQIEEERSDKNEWKELAQVRLQGLMDALKENKTGIDSLNSRLKAGS